MLSGVSVELYVRESLVPGIPCLVDLVLQDHEDGDRCARCSHSKLKH